MPDESKFAEQACPICLGDFKNPQDTGSCLPCSHWFCRSCVMRLTKRECPLCKRPIDLICPPVPAPVIRPADAAQFQGDIAILDDDLSLSPPFRRCRMWLLGQPSVSPRPCRKPATWRDHSNRAFCGHHARPLLMHKDTTDGTLKCEAMTGRIKPRPARRCNSLADGRTGLCFTHNRDILGTGTLPPSYRENLRDDNKINLAIASVLASQ